MYVLAARCCPSMTYARTFHGTQDRVVDRYTNHTKSSLPTILRDYLTRLYRIQVFDVFLLSFLLIRIFLPSTLSAFPTSFFHNLFHPYNDRENMGHDESGEGHLQLKIRGGDGEEVVFKVKKATQFSKIFHAYCQRKGIQENFCRYGQRDDISRILCALTLLSFLLICNYLPDSCSMV